jgi:hypothetical protein
LWRQQGLAPTDEERFDFASGLHEDTLAKAAGALGQTFAGAVLTDDLVALEVLAAEEGIDPERLGTFGFSRYEPSSWSPWFSLECARSPDDGS